MELWRKLIFQRGSAFQNSGLRSQISTFEGCFEVKIIFKIILGVPATIPAQFPYVKRIFSRETDQTRDKSKTIDLNSGSPRPLRLIWPLQDGPNFYPLCVAYGITNLDQLCFSSLQPLHTQLRLLTQHVHFTGRLVCDALCFAQECCHLCILCWPDKGDRSEGFQISVWSF